MLPSGSTGSRLIFSCLLLFCLSTSAIADPIGVWNSYLNHVNHIECHNLRATPVTFTLNVFQNNGELGATEAVTLAAQGTHHFSVARLLGTGGVDSYGTYRLDVNDEANAAVHCHTMTYRLLPAGSEKPLQYAFSIPMKTGESGDRFGIFNSMDPEGRSSQPVFNWLSVINTAASNFAATVYLYDLDGNSIGNFRLSDIRPNQRVDQALAHDRGQILGMYKIVPDNSGSYVAFLTRYSQQGPHFNFAFPLQALPGYVDPGPLAASSMDPALNWGEVANTTDRPIAILVTVRDQSGEERFNQVATLAPYAQRHYPLHSYLGPRSLGTFHARVLDPTAQNRILAQSVYYGTRPSPPLRVIWAYASEGESEVLSGETPAFSSINTALGAANWNKLRDAGTYAPSFSINMFAANGMEFASTSVTVPPAGSRDVGFHQFYGQSGTGLARFTTDTDNRFTSETLRVFPATDGTLGYVMRVKSFTATANGIDNSSSPGNSSSQSSSHSSSGSSSSLSSSAQSSSSSSSDSRDDPRCIPTASAIAAPLRENSDLSLPLLGHSACPDINLGYSLVTQPARGQASIENNILHYSVDFHSGLVEFAYRACIIGRPNICSAAASIRITVTASEFSGRHLSLAPYKENISEREARYLAAKVGFGGCPAVIQLGATQGLSAMVEALLDEQQNGGCTYTLPILASSNSLGVARPSNTNPDAFTFYKSHPARWDRPPNHWRGDLLFRTLFFNSRYRTGPAEYMAWMFLHPLFSADFLGSGSVDYKQYYNVMSRHGLGHFGDVLRELYGPLDLPPSPAVDRLPAIDPLLSFNPDRSVSSGTTIYDYSGPYRAWGIKVYQTYLGNETNSILALNENEARELLEIRLAGTKDLITHNTNYQEEDVRTVARAISGIAYDYDGNNNADDDPDTRLTTRPSDDAGPTRHWLGHFPLRSNLRDRLPLTIFPGQPFAQTAVFTARYDEAQTGTSNLLERLLETWPAIPRRVGARLFTQMVTPELNEEIVSTLASTLLQPTMSYDWRAGRFVAKRYSLKSTLALIMSSQAMFSPAAVGQGVASPFEMLISFLRLADIPTLHEPIPDVVLDELKRAGDLPGEPPNVFGWPRFGVPTQSGINDGSFFLNPTSLLGTLRSIMTTTNFILTASAGPPDVREFLFPQGRSSCHNTDSRGCPTPIQVVNHVLRLFNLVGLDADGVELISPEERQILVDYLNPPAAPWPQATLGRDSNYYYSSCDENGCTSYAGTVLRRLTGLLYLVGASHPARHRR